eukprot:6383424-Prymnesium_polylepis.1
MPAWPGRPSGTSTTAPALRAAGRAEAATSVGGSVSERHPLCRFCDSVSRAAPVRRDRRIGGGLCLCSLGEMVALCLARNWLRAFLTP